MRPRFHNLKNLPEPYSQTTRQGNPRDDSPVDADPPVAFDITAASTGDGFENDEFEDDNDKVPLRRERRKSLFTRWRQAWSVVAGAGVVIAGALLWWGRADAAFVVATLGVLAWFLNERNRLAQSGIEARDREQDESELR